MEWVNTCRGGGHDRWTYESTAGLWKIVMEEATRGRPPKFTPHLWRWCDPFKGYGFRGGWGQKSMCGKCFWEDAWLHVCMHTHVCVCVMVRSKSGGASFPPALISHSGTQALCTVRSHLFLPAADRSLIFTHTRRQRARTTWICHHMKKQTRFYI